jgi:hypothetical protein
MQGYRGMPSGDGVGEHRNIFLRFRALSMKTHLSNITYFYKLNAVWIKGAFDETWIYVER